MRTVRRVAGAVIVVAATCVLMGGCSVDLWAMPTVAKSGLERSLKDELEDKKLPVEDVDCPDDLRGREDETMSCTVSAPEGEYDVKLTVTEIDGSTVRYDIDADEAPRASDGSGEESGDASAEDPDQPPQQPRSTEPQGQPPSSGPGSPETPADPTIAASELQRALESDIRHQVGGTVAVVCPDDVEARVGARTRCGISDGAETLTLDVTVVRLDASGDFQVSYAPAEGPFPSEPAPSVPAPSGPPPSEHGHGGPPDGPFETV